MLENNIKFFIYKNKWILIILLACFILSIFYSFYYQIKPLVDARAYDNIAQNIVSGNGYREVLGIDIQLDHGIDRAGPTYEYFLAGIYNFFGHSYSAVWIIQALLRVFSTLFVYLAALLIFDIFENKKKIALCSAAFFAFFPDLIEISAMLMTETLYIFLMCSFLYLFFLYINNNKIWVLITLSIALGLATLTRPPIIFFLPIVLFYLLKKFQFRRILFILLTMFIIFAPWTARNYIIYDKFMPFGPLGAWNFWAGNYHGGNGEQNPPPELGIYYSNHTVKDSYNEAIYQFKSFVNTYPLEFIKITGLRINKYFSILRPMGFWFYNSGWRQLLFVFCSAIYSLGLFILSFAGIWRAIKLKNININYLLAFTTVTPLILFITVVETRYRFQIYPFLAIFAAYYISLFFNFDKKIWFKNLLASFLVILLNGVIDGLINFNVFKDKIFSHFL